MAAGEIEAGLAAVCGELNAAHGRLVELVRQALDSHCWEGAGIHTCEQWVAWQTGLSPARARQVVQIARRSAELQVTVGALAAGELSVDQVAVVARHTPTGFDAAVAGFARSATVAQLRRALSRYRFADDGDTLSEQPDHCYVSSGFDDRGRYRLRAVLDADDGAIVDAALREAHDRLFHDGDPNVTWADAVVDVAQRSLGAVESPPRREAFRAVFHIHTDTGQACTHAGPVVPASLRRQLLCDSDAMVVGIRDGRPLDIGRTTRTVPLALRRLVEERDRGCRVPGCTRLRVQLHHVIHWEDGGPPSAGTSLVSATVTTDSTTRVDSASAATPTARTAWCSPTPTASRCPAPHPRRRHPAIASRLRTSGPIRPASASRRAGFTSPRQTRCCPADPTHGWNRALILGSAHH